MKKLDSIIWGIILIVVGVIFFGNVLDVWKFDIFFKGWWTLLIIIPSLYGFFKKEWISSSLGVAIGVLLLLASRNCIKWDMVGKAFLPIVLIAIGISLIFKPKTPRINTNDKGLPEYLGIFSGNELRITDKFNGSSVISVFGSVDLDLTNADINNDIVIDCVSVFGGIDIKLPDNVNVKTSGVPIFGGIENKNTTKGKYTVVVNYVCIFSGIDLK